MFITVKNRKSEHVIINSNSIYNISLLAELSKPNDKGINEVTFSIHFEDFEGNMYRTRNYSCPNEINNSLDNVEEIIVTTIETLLNSEDKIENSFMEEVKNRVADELVLSCWRRR